MREARAVPGGIGTLDREHVAEHPRVDLAERGVQVHAGRHPVRARAGRRPMRLPRIRGSVTIGLRRWVPRPTGDGDLPSRPRRRSCCGRPLPASGSKSAVTPPDRPKRSAGQQTATRRQVSAEQVFLQPSGLGWQCCRGRDSAGTTRNGGSWNGWPRETMGPPMESGHPPATDATSSASWHRFLVGEAKLTSLLRGRGSRLKEARGTGRPPPAKRRCARGCADSAAPPGRPATRGSPFATSP